MSRSLIKLSAVHVFLVLLMILLSSFFHEKLNNLSLSIGIAGLILLVPVLIMAQRHFLDPISNLQEGTKKMVEGDLDRRFFVFSKNEIGQLAGNLNTLAEELKKRFDQVTRDKSELETILASMVEGVIVIDNDEQIMLLSEPAHKMLDLRAADIIGRPYWEVIRNENVNRCLREAFEKGEAIRSELSVLSEDESFFNLQVSPVVQQDGRMNGLIAVFHNITELKKMEKMRREFIANVSHELKTPLTSIKGFAETLQEGAVHEEESAHRFLDIICRQCSRLENLVNDILSLSQIESNGLSLHVQEVSLNKTINSVVTLYDEKIRDKGHRIEKRLNNDLPLIRADQQMVEQVIANLLENAIKFTPDNGRITIRTEESATHVRLDVSDTGIGVPPEHLPRLFERFYRVDKARSRDLGGTGLGLAIVKHIVQAHSGKVEVHSEVNKGTTFSVFLPKRPFS